jgi:phage FluMu protein Com
MATERLKFRCYRCNQLLAVAPSKAGTIVSCPKCQADLLIPTADVQTKAAGEDRAKREVARPRKAEGEVESRVQAEAAAILGTRQEQPAPAPALAPVAAVLGELAGVIPPDLADLRPEDLRVEAEFFEKLTRAPSPPPVIEPAPWPGPEILGSSFTTGSASAPAPYFPETEPQREPVPSEPVSSPEETDDRRTPPLEKPPMPDQGSAVVPPIEIEPPSILPPGTEIRRVSQVVLPAPVVLAWSLFVLAGVALSFVAGLMIGHFLWKTP